MMDSTKELDRRSEASDDAEAGAARDANPARRVSEVTAGCDPPANSENGSSTTHLKPASQTWSQNRIPTAATPKRNSSEARNESATRKRQRKPEDPVPEEIVNKWKMICDKARKRERLRAIFATFINFAGQPCAICQSMKLTEEKFMINEFAKHSRPSRKVMTGNDKKQLEATDLVAQDEMEFGPNGLMLGKLRNIYERSEKCGFCRLVVQSVEEQGFKVAEAPTNVNPAVETSTRPRTPDMNAICHASWQVDGRVLVRDRKTGTILRQRASTRRIRLRWDLKKHQEDYLHDSYVLLVVSQTREHQGLFLGQTLSSNRVDAAKIRKWLELCDQDHGKICETRAYDYSGWKSFFGVIDVNDMMLKSLPQGARYVTLSYVWGKGDFFRTKRDNIHSLLSKEGLRSRLREMPRTIKDAINLVRQIGERYIWIDALCIIQDSERSWTLNSRVMNLVYGNSYLNICAADGVNAHAGLKGLDPDVQQPRQIIEQYNQNVRLLCTMPAETYIRQSVWNTRGWTFQERVLSPRNLIFVEGRIYFQCRTTARSGEVITEHPNAGWSLEFFDSPSLFLDQLPDRPLAVYKKALELYMLRELKYTKDILAAFNGIGNVICEASGGTLVYGLPSSHFDWALLWEAKDSPKRRQGAGDEKFPSWSWCGWEGQVMEYKPHILCGCEDNLHEWLMSHTWITWYIRDGNGNLKLVWDGNDGRPNRAKVSLRWQGYTRPTNADDGQYDHFGRFIKKEHRNLPRSKSEDFKQILDECPFGVNIIEPGSTSTMDSVAFSQNNPVKDMPYLQFYTWSASFRLRETPPRDFRRKFQRYSILDYKDDWCGTIVLDRLQAPLDLDSMYEFIAISDAKEFHPDEYDGWAYYIPTEREHSAWDLYYVLLIEVKGNIAYRVGLGKVFKEAFNNSCKPEGKQWKEYILG